MYQDERKLDFKPIGLAIKKARKANGWTQEYLAQLVDVSTRTIMYIEKGSQKPRLNEFYLLTTLLEISVDQYFYPCSEDGIPIAASKLIYYLTRWMKRNLS